jgi:hypothetical protein
MDSITINNTVIDFDGKLAMVLNNPMFSDEISYSLQSTAVDSVNNRKAFGYINRIDIKDNKTRELPGYINFGSIRYDGIFVVKYQGGAFPFYFKITGDFWSAIKDKYLADLPFDVVTFPSELNYNTIANAIAAYNNDNCEQPFCFPQVTNKKVSETFSIITPTADLINVIDQQDKQFAFIPFPFIHYILRTIFEKNGLFIKQNAFDKYMFLKRLVAPSNFLINELALNHTPTSETDYIITKITNTQSPEVTTLIPHNLTTGSLIKILNCGDDTDNGSPEFANVETRVFQVEVTDAYNFTLLNEDFSGFTKEFNRLSYSPTAITKQTIGTTKQIKFTRIGEPLDPATYESNNLFYIRSDDFSGIVPGGYGQYYEEYYITLALNWDSEYEIYLEDELPYITKDLNYDSHSYANLKVYHIDKKNSQQLHSIYYVPQGSLHILPKPDCTFKTINPANHMPYMLINDFINALKDIGIYTFLRKTFAEIKTIADILNSTEVEDISAISTAFNAIENPDKPGYSLKFTADGNDAFYKEKMPVSFIDPKYNIKDPVATKSALSPTGSETNDVRLVLDEDTYYVFNKSFLNADNNWKLLCYNNVDLLSGEGDIKIQPKLSPLMRNSQYNQYDVACGCLTFPSEVKMNLRLASYYNLYSGTVPFASSYDLVPNGNINPDAELIIKWDGLKGIYNLLLKEYLEWETNIRKDCKKVVLWPAKNLNDFDFAKKYRDRGTNYLVKSVKYEMDFKTGEIEHNETEVARC